MIVEPGASVENSSLVRDIYMESVTSSSASKRGTSSGGYRAKTVVGASGQTGTQKIGALGARTYRPELMAILGLEL